MNWGTLPDPDTAVDPRPSSLRSLRQAPQCLACSRRAAPHSKCGQPPTVRSGAIPRSSPLSTRASALGVDNRRRILCAGRARRLDTHQWSNRATAARPKERSKPGDCRRVDLRCAVARAAVERVSREVSGDHASSRDLQHRSSAIRFCSRTSRCGHLLWGGALDKRNMPLAVR